MKTCIHILIWFWRLFQWIISGLGLFDRVLYLKNGSDFLPTLSPYSLGGIPRKQFLQLYSLGRVPVEKEHYQAKYGCNTYRQVSREAFLKSHQRSAYAYRYFLSPWQKDHNHNR